MHVEPIIVHWGSGSEFSCWTDFHYHVIRRKCSSGWKSSQQCHFLTSLVVTGKSFCPDSCCCVSALATLVSSQFLPPSSWKDLVIPLGSKCDMYQCARPLYSTATLSFFRDVCFGPVCLRMVADHLLLITIVLMSHRKRAVFDYFWPLRLAP